MVTKTMKASDISFLQDRSFYYIQNAMVVKIATLTKSTAEDFTHQK